MSFKEKYGLNVAVIGASSDREKYSNKAVRAFSSEGYNVFPINPKEQLIEGHKAYRRIGDVPEKIDFASLYLNPSTALSSGIPEQLRDKDIEMVILNPGAANDELVQKLKSYKIEVQMICSIVSLGYNPDEL
jgi:predicted CoA-binding protein